jgi:hypothetical protein
MYVLKMIHPELVEKLKDCELTIGYSTQFEESFFLQAIISRKEQTYIVFDREYAKKIHAFLGKILSENSEPQV